MLIALGTDIYNVVAIPFGFVRHIANSWLGIVAIYLLVHALWIVGIHGANIVMGLVTPILLSNMAENVDGAHIAFASEFSNSYVIMGGSGAMLLACVWLAVAAKSSQLKMLGRAAIEMLKKRQGKIIFVSSVTGHVGHEDEKIYTMTKFAQRGLSQAIDKELRSQGIKTCVVCPSATKTEFEVGYGRTKESVQAAHWETADDVAQGILYACKAENTVWEIRMR
ncbi:acetoin reductase [Streptococcus infantarius subsp. infantarius]|nr:acetoin reductase [Streptococcus infantarius subsp. infantarius]